MSLETWAGWSTARAWAIIPPMDQPSTAVRPSPSAEIRALAWFAISVMPSGDGKVPVLPIPALSNTTTR